MPSSALLLLALLAAPAAASADMDVLYAGSLASLMERGLGPAFEAATGTTFRGYGGSSNDLANQIKGKLRHGDVFDSANPAVNDALTGSANGDWESWYVNQAVADPGCNAAPGPCQLSIDLEALQVWPEARAVAVSVSSGLPGIAA